MTLMRERRRHSPTLSSAARHQRGPGPRPDAPHLSPFPQGDLCVTRGWLPGRPLTFFWRSRQNSPLPSERVKRRVPLRRLTPDARPSGYAKVSQERDLCITRAWVRGRPLTDCRWVHRRLPLPLERVKSRAPLIGLTLRTRSLGYAKVSQERVKNGPALRDRDARGWVRGRPLTRRWGQRRPLPQERALRNPSLGARKTPHPALGTAPASPPGEARGRALEEAGVLQRSLRRELCVTRAWVRGRPLTDCRRVRRHLPLPLERVKSRAPLIGLTQRILRRRRRHERKTLTPGSRPGQAPALSHGARGKDRPSTR